MNSLFLKLTLELHADRMGVVQYLFLFMLSTSVLSCRNVVVNQLYL